MTEKPEQTREDVLAEVSQLCRKVASLKRAVAKERARREASEMGQQAMVLREVDRLRDELLGDVAHELRTPLAAIKGYSTMMLEYDGKLTRDQKRYSLQAIDQASDKLDGLIDQLLDMSRLRAGLLKVKKEPGSLLEILRSAVSAVQALAPAHVISLELDTGMPASIDMDRRRVSQVMDHLLMNAVKYSAGGTTVTVRAGKEESGVLVSVTDHGRGLSEQELQRVFESSYRAGQRLTPGVPGAGMSLALSKGLIDAHGGRMWAESTPGEGSTFFFTLPLKKAPGGQGDAGKA